MRKAYYAVLAAAACLATVSLLWIAGEQHYRGCVLAVEVRWPVVDQPSGSMFDDATDARKRRANALNECSRIPF